jgi:hypothetical protein
MSKHFKNEALWMIIVPIVVIVVAVIAAVVVPNFF